MVTLWVVVSRKVSRISKGISMKDQHLILMQQKLDDHIVEYNKHCADEEKRWDHLIVAQERNTQSIKELTDSTRDLVSVWKAADGTVKTMSAVGRFMKWLSGFAVIGVFIKWVIEYGN